MGRKVAHALSPVRLARRLWPPLLFLAILIGLWELALAITQHNAGDTAAADERAVRLAAEQLVRFARGEPLRNVVREPR